MILYFFPYVICPVKWKRVSAYSVLFPVAELGPVGKNDRKVYFSRSREIPPNNKSCCPMKQLAQVLGFLSLGRWIVRSWELSVKDIVKRVYALKCRETLLTLKTMTADHF